MAYCPSQALLLNQRPDERMPLPEGAGTVSPETITFYLKKRWSVQHFTSDPVPRDKILEILDIASYAASGSNGQRVQWLVVHDPFKVKKIAGLTIEWMKTFLNTAHPMSGYAPMFIATWEQGHDVICRLLWQYNRATSARCVSRLRCRGQALHESGLIFLFLRGY
jgi:hypothetical protein